MLIAKGIKKIKKKFGNLQNQRCTWRVRALVCFVTKKLVRFTKYASAELNSKYQMILTSSLARASVIPTTFSSMISVNGSKITTAMGAMYRRRFIEFSFSLEEKKKTYSNLSAYKEPGHHLQLQKCIQIYLPFRRK